jgi:hypothetical protein
MISSFGCIIIGKSHKTLHPAIRHSLAVNNCNEMSELITIIPRQTEMATKQTPDLVKSQLLYQA